MIKFAIVGCGQIAQRHAKHIHHVGKLLAVCDIEKNKADTLAKNGVKAYDSLDAMLEQVQVDVVAICTPNGYHCEHSVKCLQRGFHVLCEKPMAICSAECQKMLTTSQKNNKKLFIVKQNRFNPPVLKIKQAIVKGHLGKILSFQLNCFWNRGASYYQNSNWRGRKDLDGGTLFTQFSHFIDLLYWLFGEVKKVHTARLNNFLHQETIEFEDTGMAILEFAKGTLGSINFTINSFKKNMEGSLTIFGEKGTVKIGGQYLNELEYQNVENYEIIKIAKGNRANDYGHYQGSMSNHDKVYLNVVDVLTRNGKIATDGYEGLKTVEIIEKIYAASS